MHHILSTIRPLDDFISSGSPSLDKVGDPWSKPLSCVQAERQQERMRKQENDTETGKNARRQLWHKFSWKRNHAWPFNWPSNLACPKSLGSLQASHLDSHQRKRERKKEEKPKLSWKSSDLLFIGTCECTCANATFIRLYHSNQTRGFC